MRACWACIWRDRSSIARAPVFTAGAFIAAEMATSNGSAYSPELGRSVITLGAGMRAAGIHPRARLARASASAPATAKRRRSHDAGDREGLTGVTHLYNAMPPLGGRAPGIVGTALADTRLIAGLIVDGLHVDPVSMRAAFAAKGADGIALVTDGMPTVGAQTRRIQSAAALRSSCGGRLVTAGGTLAGAHLDMASAVRNTVRLRAYRAGRRAYQRPRCTPARFLGLEHEDGGIIAPGARADLVALDAELGVIARRGLAPARRKRRLSRLLRLDPPHTVAVRSSLPQPTTAPSSAVKIERTTT